MSTSIRVQINSDTIRKVLQSREMQAEVKRRAEAIADAAGGEPDFEARVEVVGGSSKLGRAMGYVAAATPAGREAEARDRTLTRAIDAGRG